MDFIIMRRKKRHLLTPDLMQHKIRLVIRLPEHDFYFYSPAECCSQFHVHRPAFKIKFTLTMVKRHLNHDFCAPEQNSVFFVKNRMC